MNLLWCPARLLKDMELDGTELKAGEIGMVQRQLNRYAYKVAFMYKGTFTLYLGTEFEVADDGA